MDLNFSLDAIKHGKRFDGTLFQNWKHSMEIMFEFKDVKEIVEVSERAIITSITSESIIYCITGNRSMPRGNTRGGRRKCCLYE